MKKSYTVLLFYFICAIIGWCMGVLCEQRVQKQRNKPVVKLVIVGTIYPEMGDTTIYLDVSDKRINTGYKQIIITKN